MGGRNRVRTMTGAIILVLAATIGSAWGQQREYPVIIGFKWGYQNPSLDGYNLLFSEHMTPQVVSGVAVRVREVVTADTTAILRASPTSVGFVANAKASSGLFSSSYGFGGFAMLRLHNNIFARFDGDMSKETVWHRRNFGGIFGYESNEITLTTGLATLLVVLPHEGRWWPRFHVGVGVGGAQVSVTTLKVTNTGSVISSGIAFAPLVGFGIGMQYPISGVLQDRIALTADYQITNGTFDQEFLVLGATGAVKKDSLGASRTETRTINVGSPTFKIGLSFSFGEIKPRGEKGVLTNYLKNRQRGGGWASRRGPATSGAFVMVPGGGGGGGYYDAGSAAPSRINEEQIRSIIREELQNAQLTSPVTSMDSIAEQQLQVIRQRRSQAEEELQRLRELLREEG